MKHTTKKLDKSQVEFKVTVEPKDYEKHLKTAAVRISERAAIKGFRPGKAPYETVKLQVGEMGILQEALEKIIQETFYEVTKEEKLETVGMPDIKVDKVAPGNDLTYTATVALLPKVKIADLANIKIQRKQKPVDEKQINEVIDNLRKMQSKETVKDGGATGDDKVVIDMNLFLDNVPVEGGTAKDFGVYLSEDHYIPGFAKELEGLKKGDTKEFYLTFPKTYYQKILAGNKTLFKVKVKGVFERTLPEVNDEFAKALGQESVEKLKELLKHNLEHEAEHKADEQAEIEIFETLIDKSDFEEMPEVLIDSEKKKMYYELTRDLEKNGVTIEQYLQDIKKKEEDLFNDFKVQAEKRAKAALLSRAVAKEEKLTVSEEELQKEIEMMKDVYKDNSDYIENLKSPEVKETLRNFLLNKKTITWLKDKVMEK